MYRIEFSDVAIKALANVPRSVARTIRERLDTIAADPYGPHPYAKAFGGGVFRLRVADWRALYELHDDRLGVVVVRIAHRTEAYR